MKIEICNDTAETIKFMMVAFGVFFVIGIFEIGLIVSEICSVVEKIL